MRGAWLILKKEFLELSKDRKTMFFTFVMPLILYPLLFTMMGRMSQNDQSQRRSKPSRLYLIDPAKVLEGSLQAQPKLFNLVPAPEGELAKALLDQKLEMALEVEGGTPEKLARH